MKQQREQHAAKAGILAGGAVFLCGFFTLNILYMMWRQQNPESMLRGLYDYKAAAIGDPVCLPLLIGSLTARAVLTAQTPKSWQKLCCIAAGILGVLSGILIQVTWLLRDDMELNWSIPSLHHFNAAGWEHAVFFALVIGAIMYLLFRRALYPEKNAARKKLLLLDFTADFSACFFMQLHAHDEYLKFGNRVPVLLLTAAVTLLILILLHGCRLLQAARQKDAHPNESAAAWIPIFTSGILSMMISFRL